MNADRLLALYERVADAPGAVTRLRRFVLDLAVRGKLVEQEEGDEPASELLKRIAAEKARLVKAGEIRKKEAQNSRMAEPPHDLPASWRWISLGTAFLYDAGNKREPNSLDPSWWLLELEDIEKETGRLLARIGVADRDSKSTKSEFQPGDILYGKLRPYLTKVLVADEPGYSTTEIVAIRPFLPICPEYGALALRRPDFVDYVIRLGQGTKMPRLRTEDAVISPFPLPPLAEQRRIVAKVEELMALLDRLEAARAAREATRDRLTAASLARLTSPGSGPDADPAEFPTHARSTLATLPALTTRPDQIKPLRQTILNLAVRGKLVKQDAEDEPAQVGKHKIEDEPPFDAPFGWQWVPFSAVAAFENGDRSKKYPKRAEYVASGVPWINTGHIEPDGTLSRSAMYFITDKKFASLGGGKIRPGDLVYCLRGATFGKTAFVEPYERGAIASSLMIIRPGGQIDRQYTFVYLTSPLGREQLRRFDNGTAQPNLSSASVKRYEIPLPPLAEQHRIVAKVDALMALCDRLEAALTTTDTTRARLLDALLHDALDPAALPARAVA